MTVFAGLCHSIKQVSLRRMSFHLYTLFDITGSSRFMYATMPMKMEKYLVSLYTVSYELVCCVFVLKYLFQLPVVCSPFDITRLQVPNEICPCRTN